MRRMIIAIHCLFSALVVSGQQLTMGDFTALADCHPRKFDAMLSKRGYLFSGIFSQNDTLIEEWQQAMKKVESDSVQRRIRRYRVGDKAFFSILTTSFMEFKTVLDGLKAEGFACNGEQLPLLLQKQNSRMQCFNVSTDSATFYCMMLMKLELPSPKSISFADDLLQFDSHEMLSAFFGAKNVTTDHFMLGENETVHCTVIFQHTPREAVFIWKDAVNRIGLGQVIIGGSARTGSAATFTSQIRPNSWMLRNGIHFNMRLDQLVKLNEDDIHFFGRSSDFYLNIMQQRKAAIDFSNTGVILDCLNCSGSPLLDAPLVSAADALNHSLRLHVGTIILFAE